MILPFTKKCHEQLEKKWLLQENCLNNSRIRQKSLYSKRGIEGARTKIETEGERKRIIITHRQCNSRSNLISTGWRHQLMVVPVFRVITVASRYSCRSALDHLRLRYSALLLSTAKLIRNIRHVTQRPAILLLSFKNTLLSQIHLTQIIYYKSFAINHCLQKKFKSFVTKSPFINNFL